MITMNDTTLNSPSVVGTGNLKLSVPKEQRYAWIPGTLKRTSYFSSRKKEKSVIREYLIRGSGYSDAQLTRLIYQYKKHRWIGRNQTIKNSFPTRYTKADILQLVKTDEAHQQLSGSATKKLFERAYHIYKDERYERLSTISVAHIYNLRKGIFY